MPLLDIDISRFENSVVRLFRECTPKILVVTDGLNYVSGASFGLTEFVNTLRTSTIHSMTPLVTTARFDPSPAAVLSYDPVNRHINNFKFSDATHGVLKSRYDVVFLLSINRQTERKLTDEPGALAAMTAFMQAGGGVFGTGDHEDLGAGMCMEVPRVRNMRYWTTSTPSAGGVSRLSTNLPGRGDQPASNDTYEFSDQSDRFPQRLFVNYRTQAAGASFSPLVNYAHPVLQIPGSVRAIEVFPDHPHEGECIIPRSLTTKLADGVTDEWPMEAGIGTRVAPEMVALTMSHGNGLPPFSKQPVVPRSFMAICAYDGHRANVGRVVTDATWHHFVNINIEPALAGITGRDRADIEQYYRNLATWLMPKRVRLCRRFPLVLGELAKGPLFEELRPLPPPERTGPRLREVGERVEAALLTSLTRAEVSALLDDALDEAVGTDAKNKLFEVTESFVGVGAREAALAALGSLTLAAADRFNEIKDKADIDGEKAFLDIGRPASAFGVKAYLTSMSGELGKLQSLFTSLAG